MSSDKTQAAPAGNMTRVLRMLSACAFFTTLPIYSPNIMALNDASVDAAIGPFVQPLMVFSLIASALLVAIYMRTPSLRLGKVVSTVGIVFYAAGCLGFAAMLWLASGDAGFAAVVCAAVTAVGLVLVAPVWTRAFAEADLARAMLVFALVTAVSVVCNLVLASVGTVARIALYVALVLMGVAWPVATVAGGDDGMRACGRKGEDTTIEVEQSEVGTLIGGGADAAHERVRIGPFLSVMGTPLLGMLISSFATGIKPIYIAGGPLSVYHIGMAGAAVILVICWMFRKIQPFYAFVYQAAMPVLACAAVVVCAVPVSTNAIDVSLTAITVFYSFVSAMALASACAIANAHEFPRAFVFSTIILVFSCMSLLGLVLGSVVSFDDASYYAFVAVTTAAYCGWMLLHGSIKAWRLSLGASNDVEDPLTTSVAGKEPHAESVEIAESFEDRLARIASEAGLSPRETEIMGYVGRGHSSVYVAKNLLISESTVYTHVRNIYRKLEISSREQLIQMLNERDAA